MERVGQGDKEAVGFCRPLNPGHPICHAQSISYSLRSNNARPSYRDPDREVWNDVGILADLLARLQQYDKADQRGTFNDALIFSIRGEDGTDSLDA
ncbi:hypothetical protein [Granulicella sp. dw_53]|uniref:hypothetical protein n=1 Tax=Granulicella sp. dw_53 TaxID=2719792 RepID=UPI001BD49036|nr:hypothetical protein [Granulicella sp. dw_53]